MYVHLTLSWNLFSLARRNGEEGLCQSWARRMHNLREMARQRITTTPMATTRFKARQTRKLWSWRGKRSPTRKWRTKWTKSSSLAPYAVAHSFSRLAFVAFLRAFDLIVEADLSLSMNVNRELYFSLSHSSFSHCQIFVVNLPPSMTAEEIAAHFSPPYGTTRATIDWDSLTRYIARIEAVFCRWIF